MAISASDISARIVAAVMAQKLAPGSRLGEQQLALLFDCSRTIVREVVPNVLLPVLSFAFVVIAVLIIAEGSLAFLGLGLQKPQPTWGNMIAEGDLTANITPQERADEMGNLLRALQRMVRSLNDIVGQVQRSGVGG